MTSPLPQPKVGAAGSDPRAEGARSEARPLEFDPPWAAFVLLPFPLALLVLNINALLRGFMEVGPTTPGWLLLLLAISVSLVASGSRGRFAGPALALWYVGGTLWLLGSAVEIFRR